MELKWSLYLLVLVVENIKKVSEAANVAEIQKICMVGPMQILRKVLNWLEWLMPWEHGLHLADAQ